VRAILSCLDKKTVKKAALLQALALFIYCSIVGLIFWKGNTWFGTVPNYWGPLLFLILFSTSALVCAICVLGYPVYLFWVKDKKEKAIQIVVYTAAWLIFILILLMFSFLVI